MGMGLTFKYVIMKHLTIRNLGPLDEVDIELRRINVIIGPQSSGKSCVLKTACYCTWVEKRIELTQKVDLFGEKDRFIKELVRFHKLEGYIRENTYVEYESDYMHFSYDNTYKKFTFEWKNRWGYKGVKVTYIPAERNMVAAIPNWFDVQLADDNIRSFMSDWEVARKATVNELAVLNLDVSYRYDPMTNSDKVAVAKDVVLDFTNASSGLQSLIPLYVHLNYLDKLQYTQEKKESVQKTLEKRELQRVIYAESNGKEEIYLRYVNTDHCDIFLEEPEENLFPPTQSRLVEWLLAMSEGEYANNLFIATHSPYVLTSFLERKDVDLSLFLTNINEKCALVKTASEEDIQEIYDNGVDVFFNLESFV